MKLFSYTFFKNKELWLEPNLDCDDNVHSPCNYVGSKKGAARVSANMLRYQLYQYWASLYDSSAIIMLTDFADVLFQSNPFTYMRNEWMPPRSQLAIFQEMYPNKILKDCPFNSGWIKYCYGLEALEKIGLNTVSCSGVTMGTRDAIFVYSYMMNQQLDPSVRWGEGTTTKSNDQCISTGMDQGFHNWLVYSGLLSKFMDITVFKQGQGAVNTLGSLFSGENALLKFNLKQWNILRGEGNDKYISNWNGDKSPVVHQYDRFFDFDFKPDIETHLEVLKSLKG